MSAEKNLLQFTEKRGQEWGALLQCVDQVSIKKGLGIRGLAFEACEFRTIGDGGRFQWLSLTGEGFWKSPARQ